MSLSVSSMCVLSFLFVSPQGQLSSSVRQHLDSPCWPRNTPGTPGSSCCPASLNTLHRWPAEGHSCEGLITQKTFATSCPDIFPSVPSECLSFHLCSPRRRTCSGVCAWWSWMSRYSLCTFASLCLFSWNSSAKITIRETKKHESCVKVCLVPPKLIRLTQKSLSLPTRPKGECILAEPVKFKTFTQSIYNRDKWFSIILNSE